ncbi:MAG: MFS transporter [Pseudomonadota bacterium]
MPLVISGALQGDRKRDLVRRFAIVLLISFLSLIDLFGSQALLPQIIIEYGQSAALSGVAVNAATLGMAIAGLVVAWFADRIDRKKGIWVCLALLAVPTALLAATDSIWVFLCLRILQGMFMAAAFTLTMTYLSERCDVMAVGGVMAAYVTGNVASNLIGRLLAISANDIVGLSGAFLVFAALNLFGALCALIFIGAKDDEPPAYAEAPLEAWKSHWADPALRSSFGIGFIILFVFVGLFTYVNLHIVAVFDVPAVDLGLIYLVFVPALFTTPLAGPMVKRRGPKKVLLTSLAVAMAGALLTLLSTFQVLLFALAVVGAATFFAQAAATGFVGRHAKRNQAAANGIYLSSYYTGGLFGAVVIGQLHSFGGWPAAVIGLSLALGAAILLAFRLREPTD